MKTRGGTVRSIGRNRSSRNKTCAPEGDTRGRKRRNGTSSNGTRTEVQSSSRSKLKLSARSVRRSKQLQNRVQVKFNLPKEYSEDELFLLNKAVYMQQYDPKMEAHNPLKPIAWFTVAALMNVDAWTWDAVRCMNVWRSDHEASRVRAGPFSAAEDDFLFKHGDDRSEEFWHHLASVFKRDPGEVYSRWTALLATRSRKISAYEGVGSDSEYDASAAPDLSYHSPVSKVASVVKPDITGATVYSSSKGSHAPGSLTSPACGYKPIRKTAPPPELTESSVPCEKNGRNNGHCDSVSVSGGEESWEGSVSSSRSVIFPFNWDSVSISTGGE